MSGVYLPENKVITPTVSVIMNCYNGGKYLRESIESVLNQSYLDWELIFWDNLSSDNSAAIFSEYSADERLRYFCSPTHTNLGAARKLAYEETRGKFIAFLDVDDFWSKENLEKQIPLFDDESVGFSCANYYIKNEINGTKVKAINKVLPSGHVLDDLLENYFVGLLTLVVRRTALEEVGSINPRYHMIYDLDLAVKLSCGWALAVVQQPTATYRIHGSNETISQSDVNLAELMIWRDEMKDHKEVGLSKTFFALDNRINRTRAVGFIFEGSRWKAILEISKLSFSLDKVTLMVATMLPLLLLRKLMSLR